MSSLLVIKVFVLKIIVLENGFAKLQNIDVNNIGTSIYYIPFLKMINVDVKLLKCLNHHSPHIL